MFLLQSSSHLLYLNDAPLYTGIVYRKRLPEIASFYLRSTLLSCLAESCHPIGFVIPSSLHKEVDDIFLGLDREQVKIDISSTENDVADIWNTYFIDAFKTLKYKCALIIDQSIELTPGVLYSLIRETAFLDNKPTVIHTSNIAGHLPCPVTSAFVINSAYFDAFGKVKAYDNYLVSKGSRQIFLPDFRVNHHNNAI